MRYAVIFEKSEHQFGAYCPDLPGCVAVGKSLAEVKTMMSKAMTEHIARMKDQGAPPPEPASVVAYIDAS